MRGIIAILLAGLLLPVTALAQEWQTYTYADPGFAIQFPGVPVVETGRIRNSTGVSLPVTRYVVRQARITYTVSVVNYSSTNADGISTIAETERTLGAGGQVTVATGARINRAFGRELSVNGADGSRSAIAIFFVDKRLYTVVGQALPPNAIERSADAVHFQESLQFLGDNGGFGRFFRGGGGGGGVGAGVGGGDGGGRLRRAYSPQADAACVGKSAGDVVQLETPGGPVPATCTLVARPNMPPNDPPEGPPGTPNPDDRHSAAPAH